MSDQSLKRWRDEGAPLLFEAAFDAHRALGPSEAMLAQMLANVEASLPGQATTQAGQAASQAEHAASQVEPMARSHGLFQGMLGKLAVGLTVLTLGVSGWLLSSEHTVRSATPTSSHAPVAPRANASPLPAPVLPPGMPAAASVRAAVESAHGNQATHTVVPSPRRIARPAQVAPLPAVEPPQQPSPLAELSLLRRARKALSARPALSLALADEHAQTFARGVFAEEREVIAIEALLMLEQHDAAEQRALRFREAHPGSLHGRRLDVLLEAHRAKP
jgi:hypothetical protein